MSGPFTFLEHRLVSNLVWHAAGNGGPAAWRGEVGVALLDTPSLLEGAFCLKAQRTLLVSDNCLMVGHISEKVETSKSCPRHLRLKGELCMNARRAHDAGCRPKYSRWISANATMFPTQRHSSMPDGDAHK